MLKTQDKKVFGKRIICMFAMLISQFVYPRILSNAPGVSEVNLNGLAYKPLTNGAIYFNAMANRISRRAYNKKYAEQHGRCFYCADELTKKFEVDHILPFSIYKDGTNRNKCLSCVHCNRMKSNKSIDDFRISFKKHHPDKLIRGLFYFEFLKLQYNG